MNKLLYYCPFQQGGLWEYGKAQAIALSMMGVEVDFLSPPTSDFYNPTPFTHLPLLNVLNQEKDNRNKLFRIKAYYQQVMLNIENLSRQLSKKKYDAVLWCSFSEYFSPFWKRKLASHSHIPFACVVHDPIRNHKMGPNWWHLHSLRCAYSIFDVLFIHDETRPDVGNKPITGDIKQIPHGIYTQPRVNIDSAKAREQLNLPQNSKVILAFGHIRDGKNLDLTIKALAQFPEAHLVVAGQEQSGSQKPTAFYQNLAQEIGVNSRCHWFNEYIPNCDVELFFESADIILLTYSKDFRSASGVLNTAANFRKPCLASSGEGPLKTQVKLYDLGTWVEPDHEQSLIAGLQTLLNAPPDPKWDKYIEDNSWKKNAEIVSSSLFNNTQ